MGEIISKKKHFDVLNISNSDFKKMPKVYKSKIIHDDNQEGGFFGTLLGWDDETRGITKFMDIIDLME